MNKLYVFVLITAIIAGCGNSGRHNKDRKEDTDNSQKNMITPGVVSSFSAKKDPACSFAFYIPEDTLKSYPLIVLFDPHAKGKEALTRYIKLADKYQFALAASENIQNGMQPGEWDRYSGRILEEILAIAPIDTTRIFLAGFSGGARVASYLSLMNGKFRGMAGCGAGVPDINNITRTDFIYVGIAGYGDFNFSEMYSSESVIRTAPFSSCFAYFDGKHEWPPDSVMEYAFINFSSPEGYDLKPFVAKEMNSPSADNWKKYLKYCSLRDILKKKTGYDPESGRITSFLNGNESSRARADIESSLNSETIIRNGFRDAFLQKDHEWWKKQIKSYKVPAGKSNYSLNEYRNMRLTGYISMSCYMLVSSTLQNNDLQRAPGFLSIYQMADSSNADMSFYYGVFLAKTGRYKDAIDSLGNAISKGFTDISRWNEQQDFNKLRDSIRFNDLEAKLNSGQ